MLNPGIMAMVTSTSNHRCMLAIAVLSMAVAPIDGARADPLQVRDSVPAFDGVIQGRHVQYVIRFKELIDHSSSRIEITQSGRVVQSFPAFLDSAPTSYSLRVKRQVLVATYFAGRQGHP